MKTKDFVQICNKLSKVCELMADEQESRGKYVQLMFYSLDFKDIGKTYVKLDKRKDFKEELKKQEKKKLCKIETRSSYRNTKTKHI